MNFLLKSLLSLALLLPVCSIIASDEDIAATGFGTQTRFSKPLYTPRQHIRDGAIGLGAAYLLRSKLSANNCVNAASAIVVANSLMPNFVRRELHKVPVVNRLVYSGEERIWFSGSEVPVNYVREVMDVTALGTTVALATLTGHSPFTWNTLRTLAVVLPLAQNFTPTSVRKALADIPLIRKVVGARELEYGEGLVHQAINKINSLLPKAKNTALARYMTAMSSCLQNNDRAASSVIVGTTNKREKMDA